MAYVIPKRTLLRNQHTEGTSCKPDAPHSLYSHSVGVDPVNNPLDPQPNRQVCENLHDAALVGEGRLLEDGHVLEHTVLDDVLNDLVDEVDLSVIQRGVAEVFGEGFLGGLHVQTHNLPDELAQRLCTEFTFIVLLRSGLAPEDALQLPDIISRQRLIAPELGDDGTVL